MKPVVLCLLALSAAGTAGANASPFAPSIPATPAPERPATGLAPPIALASLTGIPRAATLHPGLTRPEAPRPKEPDPSEAARAPLPRASLCLQLETEARVTGLPPVFFMRLIWQESRFDPYAVSPVGASGIAQFMPATAAERGLADPFHTLSALGASAELLRDLAAEFGNIGLAAAAYNAGPGRVQRWLAGKTGLPAETRHYVRVITGHPAPAWRKPGTDLAPAVLKESEPAQDWCRALPVITMPRPRNAPVTAAAAEVPKSPTAEAPSEPAWGVQLAAYFSEQKARLGIAAVRKRHGKVLGPHRPQVVSSRTPARGRRPLYTLRVLTRTRAAADALCTELKTGGGECLVLRN